MKPYAALLVLFCYLCGLTAASAGSSEDTSISMDTLGPSTLVALPATSSPTILYNAPIYTYFITELTLEALAITATFASLASRLACGIPELFFAAFALTVCIFISKIGFMLLRTMRIREATSALASLAHLTPNRQAILASVSGAIDLSRAVAVLHIMMQEPHFCDIDIYSATNWIFLVLMATMLMGGVQLGMLVKHLHIWMRDTDEPFGLRLYCTECLQE